jgi:hypothetical protein
MHGSLAEIGDGRKSVATPIEVSGIADATIY